MAIDIIKKVALGALGAVTTGLAVAKVRSRRKKKAAAAATAKKPAVKVAKAAPKASTMPGTTASIEAGERVKARKQSAAIAQKARVRKATGRKVSNGVGRQTGHRA